MKPTLSLETLLGTPPRRHPLPATTSAVDDLAHRPLQLIWANGEGLDAPQPTRGTALLQHGFKEWSGALGVTRVAPGAVNPGRTADHAAGLWQALQRCEDDNRMPLVLCRSLDDPLQVLHHLLAQGPCGLLALGTRTRLPGRNAGSSAPFPIHIAGGLDARHAVWLGAPHAVPAPVIALPSALRVPSRLLNAGATAQQLRGVEAHWCRLAPPSLWCVLFLDDIALDGPVGCDSLAPEVLATTLRWLQRQLPWVVVFAVSHERVTSDQRGALAHLARLAGRAMHRHTDLEREPFPPRRVVAASPHPGQIPAEPLR